MPRRPRHNLDASAKERADSRRTAKARTDYQLATRKAWDHKAAIAFGRRLLGRRGCALVGQAARPERQRSHVLIVSGAPGKQVPSVTGLWRRSGYCHNLALQLIVDQRGRLA